MSVSGTESTVGPPALLQTNVALDGLPAFVRLREVHAPWSVRAEYALRSVHTVLEPITLQGETAGPAIELPTVEPVRGLFRLTVRGGEPPDPAKRSDLELV